MDEDFKDRLTRHLDADAADVATHEALQDPGLRERLEEIRLDSEVGEDRGLLQILDVAIWMNYR